MEYLKKKFEQLALKYNAKKENFKSKIEKWESKGGGEIHRKAFTLMQQADILLKELKDIFASGAEVELDKQALSEKIKSFKKIYKKLNEITKPTWRQWIEAIVIAGLAVFILRTYVFGLYHVPTGSAEPTILVGDRLWGNKLAYYLGPINHGDYIICDNPEFIYDRSNPINYFWQKYVGFPIPLLGLDVGPDNWTKRVIAIPGDTIEGRVENGKTTVYRNGKKLDETDYVNPYPLIKLIKTTGFIDMDEFGPFKIPGFLRKITKPVDYTYDSSKSFDEQPFYNMTEDEVVRRRDGSLMLKKPYTPTYEFGEIYDEIGRSVDSFGPIKVPQGKYWVMGDSRKNSRDSRWWGFLDESLIHGKASFVIFSIDSEEPFWLFELLKHPIDFWFKSVRWNRFFKWVK